ncbi:MAG: DUF1385 domain-containing protein [Chloroflexota bacterium]|nr:DUF1385 domain-containing protein [Chloroflexota bacterium]
MSEKRLYYGGQAVMEGVMIRGPRSMAIACRKPDGDIAVRQQELGGLYAGPLRRFPFVRGVIVLWETLVLGTRALIWSSNVAMGVEEKESDSAPMLAIALLSLIVVGGIFFAGPLLLADLLRGGVDNGTLVVIAEGLIRLLIIIAYVSVIGLLPDVRRVYEYHGAEHKSIHALESGDPLETASVQQHPTAHVRCGTSFLLTVVIVSVVVFAAVGSPDLWLRVVSRVVLIPVIASISYELIRLGGAFEHNPVTRVLMWPNLALQAITTKPCDESQVEVALAALKEVLAAEAELEITAPKLAATADAAAKTAPPLD